MKIINVKEDLRDNKKTNSHQEYELYQKLIKEISHENFISCRNLFRFLLGSLGLYEYHMLVNAGYYEDESKQKDTEFLNKLNEEMAEQQETKKIYGGFDGSGNYYMTIEDAKKIKNKFGLFYINLSATKKMTKQKKANHETETFSHKPQIDKHSQSICNQFRRKIQEEFKDENNRSKNNNAYLDYIDLLLLKKKKNENKKQYMRDKLKEEQTETYPFRPTTLEYVREGETLAYERDPVKRFNDLYDLGKALNRKRKDKAIAEIELDSQAAECTFKPKTGNIETEFGEKFFDEVYDNSYKMYFDRLENGRFERKVKDAVHSREEFPKELDARRKGLSTGFNSAQKTYNRQTLDSESEDRSNRLNRWRTTAVGNRCKR